MAIVHVELSRAGLVSVSGASIPVERGSPIATIDVELPASLPDDFVDTSADGSEVLIVYSEEECRMYCSPDDEVGRYVPATTLLALQALPGYRIRFEPIGA